MGSRLAFIASLVAALGAPVSGDVLYDNGSPDGLNGFSNATSGVFGFRRTLLDDFEVPFDEVWRLEGMTHFAVWNTLPPGSGQWMEVAIWSDDDGDPNEPLFDLVVTDYREEPTGVIRFDREEYAAWTEVEPADLPRGRYWFEATVVGPENNFWLTAPTRHSQCWVNYEDLGGLQPGGFEPSDISWLLRGTRTVIESGACCLLDGTCLDDVLPPECAGKGGDFRGAATICAEVACAPFGACCLDGGACLPDTLEMDCMDTGGVFQGEATTCAEVACPPFGACCFFVTCVDDLDVSDCINAGGDFQGEGVVCSNVTCPPNGACCVGEGCVDDVPDHACAGMFGMFQGPGSRCAEAECPVGACCLYDGACAEGVIEAFCMAARGSFRGAGSLCDDVSCPALGACCIEDGGCLEALVESDCLAQGGEFLGVGLRCANETVRLVASDADPNDKLGYTVSIDGATAVVGAFDDDDGGQNAGAVYVYERGTPGLGGWTETQKLIAGDAIPHDNFGYAVAIDGSTVVVGATGADIGGAAYVFERGPGIGGSDAWTQVARLIGSDVTSGDRFGSSVSIDGTRVLVGAPFEDNGGSVYVFERDEDEPGAWGEVARLTASVGESGDRFGDAVAIDGLTAIAGAPFWNETGGAFVFQRQGGVWEEVRILSGMDAAPDDEFGGAVSIRGNTALVGAAHDDETGTASGSAYVYERSGVEKIDWLQRARLTASDAGLFGFSVSLGDEIAVIGAPLTEIGLVDVGAAYLFERGSAAEWREVSKLQPSPPARLDFFGSAIAATGDTVIVGNHRANEAAGAAHVFDWSSCRGCIGDLDGSGDVGFGDLLAVLVAWGPCACPEDLNHDGIVDVEDVLVVLAGWGACPG